MNDFTREQLQIILLDMNAYIYRTRTAILAESPSHKALRDKIESMIDNYCNHECNGETEIFVDTCRKCNAYLLRESHYE